jgi:hypothetical protein
MKADSCEYDYEPFDITTGKVFLDEMNDVNLLYRASALWSYSVLYSVITAFEWNSSIFELRTVSLSAVLL